MIFIDTIKKLNAPRKKANPENEILSWGDKMPDYIANSILFVVAFFAAIVALLAFGSLTSANAAQVQDCTIWQTKILKTSRYKSITVKVFSKAETSDDRLATAKAVLDDVKEKTGFDIIDVWVFAPGTEPIKDHLEKGNAIATVSHTTAPGKIIGYAHAWQGSFTDEKTPVKMTDDDRRYSLNPLFDREYKHGDAIKNLKYKPGECSLTKHRFRKNFAHPDLK